MVFCCRELLFSKLFYRHQQQQPPPPVLRAAAGNRIFRPCSSFRAMVFCCRGLLFSKLFYRHQQQQPSPPVLRAAASDRIFFKAMVFYCREMLCSKLFSREQLQATESLDKCFFPRISDDMLGSFFACFWTLLVLPSHGVLLPGATFFEAVLPASAAAAAATSFCEQPQATESLDNLSTMCCFSRISDDTLGSFLAWFWTLLVLQSHGVLLPGAAFFEAGFLASAAAAAATSRASSRRRQNLSTIDKCCFSMLFICCFFAVFLAHFF